MFFGTTFIVQLLNMCALYYVPDSSIPSITRIHLSHSRGISHRIYKQEHVITAVPTCHWYPNNPCKAYSFVSLVVYVPAGAYLVGKTNDQTWAPGTDGGRRKLSFPLITSWHFLKSVFSEHENIKKCK